MMSLLISWPLNFGMYLKSFLANLGCSVMFQQCRICPERILNGYITTCSNSMFLVTHVTKHSKNCLKNSRKTSVSLYSNKRNLLDASYLFGVSLDSACVLFLLLGSLGCCGWFWLAVGGFGWFWLVACFIHS